MINSLLNILQLSEDPKIKLNKMLDWIITCHGGREDTPGCPIGNLTIEMSEHDETFRLKLEHFFKRWIVSIEKILEEMVKQNQLDPTGDIRKSAEAIVAMIEGGILLMKSQQDISILMNVIDVIRQQFHLS